MAGKGISAENAVAATTAYDPTCGSGSLLLKVAAEANTHITLEGQEMDVTTAGLARMNMILHDFPDILQGNTLASPKFKDEQLRTTIMSSPIRPFQTRPGAPASRHLPTPTSAFSGASHLENKATTLTCFTSSGP